MAELEWNVGQQSLRIDLLKGCLQRIEEQQMAQARALGVAAKLKMISAASSCPPGSPGIRREPLWQPAPGKMPNPVEPM